jgi:hypothetical protein
MAWLGRVWAAIKQWWLDGYNDVEEWEDDVLPPSTPVNPSHVEKAPAVKPAKERRHILKKILPKGKKK